MNKTYCQDLYAEALAISENGTQLIPLDMLDKLTECFPRSEKSRTERLIRTKETILQDKLILAYAIVLTVTAVIGAIGNLAVIVYYGSKFKSLSPWKFLNLHLACCDFIFAIMQVIQAAPTFAGEIGTPKWPLGLSICKITKAALVLGSLIAVQNILIIAVERYKGILNPLGQMIDAHKRVKIALAIAWFISMISCIPMLLVSDIEKNGACDSRQTWAKHQNMQRAYQVYLLVFFGLMPLSLVSCLYGIVIKTLRKPKAGTGIFANLTEAEIHRRRATEMRIIKMLVAVVIAFFFCVMPIRIIEVILSFKESTKMSTKDFFTVVYVGFLPYPLHVAINPFIYSLTDKEFCKGIIKSCGQRLCGRDGMTSRRSTTTEALQISLISSKRLRGISSE
eukprot:Seg4477.1 transcript_id=Seg4477.1/GoldUCD/mRNA.D3Y31 product="Neuropeptide S receptor" protein_id=Seg4477.1/GoldUCD/D3Y31